MTEPWQITGTTRVYAIVGDPIAQVRSPQVFNALFRESGADAVMVPLHVPAAGLETAWRGLAALPNLDGVIVTMPHKMRAAGLVDRLGGNAKLAGAVNAARREADGKWLGDMFDGIGCVEGLRGQGHDVAGKRVLIVGAGGAGSAIAYALAQAGIAALTVHDVDTGRARKLADGVARAFPKLAATAGPPDPRGVDMVLNATPLGMKPDDPLPLDAGLLDARQLVVDVVMKPERTRLIEAAAARGCKTQIGKHMLDAQARAVARFFGIG